MTPDPLESEYLQNRAYKPAGGDGRLVAIPQPSTRAMALYEALTAVREAEEALAAAQARTPDYTAQYREIDFYGAEQTALNLAIINLGRVWGG